MRTRTRTTLAITLAAPVGAGCSTVLGIDSNRHLASTADAGEDAGLDAGLGGWWCENNPVPDAAAGPIQVELFVNDVSTASSQNSFAGNPVPGASVLVCSTLDLDCSKPIGPSFTSDEAGVALVSVPSGFSGYYELMASGFTSAIASHTPQLGNELLQQGMVDVSLLAAGGGLAGVTADPNLPTAIVSVLDCNESPAPNMVFVIGAPGATEKLVYLANSLPSASATQTDSTGSAIIYNVPPGTLRITASFAADNRTFRSISTLARTGWVTFVQIRLDQSAREPIGSALP